MSTRGGCLWNWAVVKGWRFLESVVQSVEGCLVVSSINLSYALSFALLLANFQQIERLKFQPVPMSRPLTHRAPNLKYIENKINFYIMCHANVLDHIGVLTSVSSQAAPSTILLKQQFPLSLHPKHKRTQLPPRPALPPALLQLPCQGQPCQHNQDRLSSRPDL